MSVDPKLRPGDRVSFAGGDLQGVIEEVIWARNAYDPFLLVEYWLDGQLQATRLHAEDITKIDQEPRV